MFIELIVTLWERESNEQMHHDNAISCGKCNNISTRNCQRAFLLKCLFDRANVLEIPHPKAPFRCLFRFNTIHCL